jgi:hypothetical protein
MKDKIRFGPELSPGQRTSFRRRAESPEDVEVGVFVEAKDGQQIPEGAELISVEAESEDGWHGAETLYKSGPSQVATPKYREGYERIFGGRQRVGEA